MEREPKTQSGTAEERQEIENREVAELEQPIKRILEQILPKIEAGEYGLIIGDDVSGRVPTRIFEKVISQIYGRFGFQSPHVRFFAGKKFGNDNDLRHEALTEFVRKSIQNIPDNARVLIVTDTVTSGDTLDELTDVLKENKLSYDAVTVGLGWGEVSNTELKRNMKFIKKRLGGEVYHGQVDTPKIWKSRLDIGIRKNRDSSEALHSEVSRDEYDNEDRKRERQQMVNSIREDSFIVADHLIEWYEKQKESRGGN